MRILHTSDFHVTEGAHFDDTLRCLDAMIETGIAEKVDAWIVAGDLHGCVVPHKATPVERNAVSPRLQVMASHAPVLICYGNHDYPGDLDVYAKLAAPSPIIVAYRPGYMPVAVANGHLGIFYFLPYPSKRLLMRVQREAVGLGIEDQKAIAETGLRAILADFRQRAAGQPELPHVLIAHLNIGGSRIAGDEQLIGQEIELAPHDLDELGMSYCALGHIHRRQQIARKAFYCGAPSMQNHGEESYEPGYLIVDIDGEVTTVTEKTTPARRLVTIEMTCGGARIEWTMPEKIEGLDIKLRARVPEEDRVRWERELDEWKELLLANGAHAVKTETRVIPRTRIRSAAIEHATTLEDKLRAYWMTLDGATPPKDQFDRCVKRLAELEVAS